jgi:hypothetical protein
VSLELQDEVLEFEKRQLTINEEVNAIYCYLIYIEKSLKYFRYVSIGAVIESVNKTQRKASR